MFQQKTLRIHNRLIGYAHPPYIIAEMSANHNGDIHNAFRIIDAAKASGADAVKLQTYTPDTITLKADGPDFQISGGLWDGRTLYDLYEEAHMPWDWHKPLFEHAQLRGITIFSSPFDYSAVDLLEDLNAPAYKIASFEAIDLPLIQYVARTGKPMIISTGMANADEIKEAVDAAYSGGCQELALLHCVSGYPSPAADYNLRTLTDMSNRFDVPVGLSDHTLDNATALAAVALGACIVEKHFTLDRHAGGPDDSFSIEPRELTALCKDARTAWESLGKITYEQQSSEIQNIQFRRSLYFKRAMQIGEKISPQDIVSVRPGYGLAPKFYDQLIGKELIRNASYAEPVTWQHFGHSALK
jgi:N-acetylneuraminate synthase